MKVITKLVKKLSEELVRNWHHGRFECFVSDWISDNITDTGIPHKSMFWGGHGTDVNIMKMLSEGGKLDREVASAHQRFHQLFLAIDNTIRLSKDVDTRIGTAQTLHGISSRTTRMLFQNTFQLAGSVEAAFWRVIDDAKFDAIEDTERSPCKTVRQSIKDNM